MSEERVIAVGASESGKSYTARCEVARLTAGGRPWIVFDPIDSPDAWRPVGAVYVAHRGQYLRALALGAPVIVVRSTFTDWSTVPAGPLPRGVSSRIAGLRGRVVVIDEATIYAPRQRCDPSLVDLVTRGRHLGCSLIVCTHRPADLAPVFWANATRVYVHTLGHGRDYQAVTEHLRLPARWSPRWRPVGPPAGDRAVHPLVWDQRDGWIVGPEES